MALSEIKVAITGNTEIGPLEPGYTIQEFATPRNPADSAGGTGSVGFSGRQLDKSPFLINKPSVVTHPELGTVSGVIRNVTLGNMNVSATQDTGLARFDADRNIPPLTVGSVPCALDLVDQLTGTTRLAASGGTFWSLAGHGAGFDSNGQLVPFGQQRTSYTYYNNALARDVTEEVVTYTDAAIPFGATTIGGKIYATSMQGDSLNLELAPVIGYIVFAGSQRPSRAQAIVFKARPNGSNVVFTLQGQPLSATQGSGQETTVTINPSLNNLVIRSEYWQGGLRTVTTDTQSLLGLDLSEEIAVYIQIEGRYDPLNLPLARYIVSASVCNTSNYATYLDAKITFDPDGRDVWFLPWTITGNVRSLWRYATGFPGLLSLVDPIVPVEYEAAPNYDFSGTPTFGEPAIGFNGNCWQYLQAACSAYGWEIGLENDVPTARTIGGRALDISNYEPSHSVAISGTFTGRQVDVVYQNSQLVVDGEVYNARDDDNRILSVEAGRVVTTTVNSSSYLIAAIDPERVTTFIPGAGTYYVVDSTGLPIVANQWEDYGGNVQVSINPNTPGGIDIRLTGPTVEIPSTSSPYSLAVSDGQNQYAALSIFGTAVVTNPKTLNLLTGASEAQTPQQLATTIQNPHIGTLERAYDAGIWASVDAAGPRLELTLTVPTRALSGFGLTPGSLVRWRDNQYRVMSASIGNLRTSLTCVRHVTVDDFDGIWSGQTVANHDSLWSPFVAYDQNVEPFKQTTVVPIGGFGEEPFGLTQFGP